jgi:hypothetical protein
MKSSGLQAAQSGGDRKEVKRAHEHEKNVSVVGTKIFFSNVANILMQALLQKYDILDCAVVIDLCHAPPTVEVKLASVFLSDSMDREHTDPGFLDRTKYLVEQNRQNGSLTVAVKSLGAVLLKIISGEFAPLGSWSAQQADLRSSMDSDVESLLDYPDELLPDLRLAKHIFDGC